MRRKFVNEWKRWMALLLALVMSFSLFACGAKPAENTGDNSQNTAADGTTRVFTDSCGREVTVPVTVEKLLFPAHWPRSWFRHGTG